MVPLYIPRLGATVMSNHSNLQLLNPDRANKWPMRTNPNRARERSMRIGHVTWLSGVQAVEGEMRHDS
jgi:hypothetical protein